MRPDIAVWSRSLLPRKLAQRVFRSLKNGFSLAPLIWADDLLTIECMRRVTDRQISNVKAAGSLKVVCHEEASEVPRRSTPSEELESICCEAHNCQQEGREQYLPFWRRSQIQLELRRNRNPAIAIKPYPG